MGSATRGGSIEATQFQGIPALCLAADKDDCVVVSLEVPQVLSWQVADREQLYLEERSGASPGSCRFGGIAPVFPRFEPTVRCMPSPFLAGPGWSLSEQRYGADFATATWILRDSDDSRANWPHEFQVELSVALARGRLDVEFAVENTGNVPLAFSAALESCLRVSEIELTRLVGLQGCTFQDLVSGDDATDGLPALVIEEPTHRLYREAPPQLLLRNGARSISIQGENLRDCVIWNPWEAVTAVSRDLQRGAFRRMLSVTGGAVSSPAMLAPGGLWCARQTLIVL